MADFLIKYPSEAALDAVAQLISGLWIPATADTPGHVGDVRGIPGIGEWALTDPFLWYKPTGATMTDSYGNTIPVMAADGSIYRVFRWNADMAHLAPYIATGGGTITTSNGVTIITAGPVTMTTPLPPDCPETF
jgi:hypothetical protein